MINFNPKLIYSRDEIDPNPSNVGKAAQDLLANAQEGMEVQEVIDSYAESYVEAVQQAASDGAKNYEGTFHIVVLHKKEPWAVNVLRNWFVTRQTLPSAQILRRDYPNHSSTVYSYNDKSGQLKLLWSLPTKQDSDTISKNRWLYHSDLVQWIDDFNSGKLR